MPFSTRTRKALIIIFFAVAASMGVVGVLQYFGIGFPQMDRPLGVVVMPGMYAGMLSFVCGSAVIMLLTPQTGLFRTTWERTYITAILLCTAAGILFFQSRGVWIAFIVAITATMFLYNRRKAAISAFVLLVILTVMLSGNSKIRERAASIITSAYTENETGSTGNRLELWKAAWMIISPSPSSSMNSILPSKGWLAGRRKTTAETRLRKPFPQHDSVDSPA
jgi:O-antigen ligase